MIQKAVRLMKVSDERAVMNYKLYIDPGFFEEFQKLTMIQHWHQGT